jgi:hypothetical protein
MGIFRSKAFQFSENWKAYYAETSRKLPKVREGKAGDAEGKSVCPFRFLKVHLPESQKFNMLSLFNPKPLFCPNRKCLAMVYSHKRKIMISCNKIADIARMKREISIKWVAADGTIISVDKAIPTSFHGNGETFNIMILPSREVRKVNRFTVTEINGEEVVL